jgi:hypothetical protein
LKLLSNYIISFYFKEKKKKKYFHILEIFFLFKIFSLIQVQIAFNFFFLKKIFFYILEINFAEYKIKKHNQACQIKNKRKETTTNYILFFSPVKKKKHENYKKKGRLNHF